MKSKIVYYYNNSNLIKYEYYYDYGNGWQLTSYVICEYDVLGNCKSIITMQDDNIVSRTDYDFYEHIKNEDVCSFVNPSVVDPTPSYKNAPSKTTTTYSYDGTSCSYSYEYHKFSSSTDLTEENTLSICTYPNPIDNHITIEGKNIYKIELYNTLGMVLYSLQADSYENLDMSQYNSGVYYMKIYTDTGSSLRKIIKK